MKDDHSKRPWSTCARIAMPLLIMGACLWALSGSLDQNLLGHLPDALAGLPQTALLAAALFSAASLSAVARYDAIAHGHFDTGVPAAQARRTGFAAIAIGQTVGFGVLTGAAVRWRMLPQLGLATTLKLSTFVSVTFILAFCFVTATLCVLLPAPGWIKAPAVFCAVGLPLLYLGVSFAPHCAPLRHRFSLPSLRAAASLLVWLAIDVVAAAAALFVLLPETAPGFLSFLPIFLLALGAAMISSAPGGVGPFELTLVALLPEVAPVDLVAAIVAFRALYYALPALLGVAIVLLSKRMLGGAEPVASPSPLPRTGPAELGLLAQNGGQILNAGQCSFAIWRTTQTATLMFDPLSGDSGAALSSLKKVAAAHRRIPVLYKCGPRTAQVARSQGWAVTRIAQDCVITPATYDPASRSRRRLRRKLRQAEQAGVQVTRALFLPLWDMAALDAAWQDRNGPARGGTMGRFCPDYLADQTVFLAHQHGRLVGFASFHARGDTHCLDLMRQGATAPAGTMHLIVHTALTYAQSEGVHRVSLAALPDFAALPLQRAPFARYLSNPGLRQFKQSFAPRLVPRYAAAPSHLGLALGLLDIAAEVHRPPPLPYSNEPHDQLDDYEVDLNARPWDPMALSVQASP